MAAPAPRWPAWVAVDSIVVVPAHADMRDARAGCCIVGRCVPARPPGALAGLAHGKVTSAMR